MRAPSLARWAQTAFFACCGLFPAIGYCGSPACLGDAKGEPLSQWVASLTHTLCERDTAESLLAVYLLSLPGFGAATDRKDVALHEAYGKATNETSVFWVAILASDCAASLPCSDKSLRLKAAEKLTAADPDNAMASLAAAFANDQFAGGAEKVSQALARASTATRVHDYRFDIVKIAALATSAVPLPKTLEKNAYGQAVSPMTLRWQLASASLLLGGEFDQWLRSGCHGQGTVEDREAREAQCAKAKVQLGHGDSLFTLSANPAAAAVLQANLGKRAGKTDAEFARVMLESIEGASSEREWYANAAARWTSP